ncbi:DUF6734 family protein [Flavobacteriaceae bacterium M23B6Z8]
MKIVQSFWSVPFLQKEKKFVHERKFGGFIEKKYFYYAWCLSALSIHKFYDHLELITDDYGLSIFGKLDLPYRQISKELNVFKNYDPELWAIGKIKAYEIQETPFIHIDGDVFLWKRLPDFIEQASVLVQSTEGQFNVFQPLIAQVKEEFPFVPPSFNHPEEGMYNAGIIGGNDIAFFKDYCKKVNRFIDENKESLHTVNKSLFNAVFEQYYLFKLIHEENVNVSLYIHDIDYECYKICDFLEIRRTQFYTHMLGKFKAYQYTCRQLESLFRSLYPHHYALVNSLLNNAEL